MNAIEGDHALVVQTAQPVCDTYGLALAGGYAIKAHGLVTRPSDDVDFATAHFAPIPEIMVALVEVYHRAGFEAELLSGGDRKGHLLVRLASGTECRVDVLKEPLNYPPVTMRIGPVLALRDAVALKMGALHDRVMPRDLIDVYGAADHFTCAELVALCRAALDEDFRLAALRDQLEYAVTMYPDEVFERYGLATDEIAAMKAWAQTWAADIAMEIAQGESWGEDEGELRVGWVGEGWWWPEVLCAGWRLSNRSPQEAMRPP